ncbi:hypothetical protein M9458_038883, partial [Cirrhinus mrigala]
VRNLIDGPFISTGAHPFTAPLLRLNAAPGRPFSPPFLASFALFPSLLAFGGSI